MGKKTIQSLETPENANADQEIKNENVENTDLSGDQSIIKDEIIEIESVLPSKEPELHPEVAIKSISETKKLIDEIEKQQVSKTEQDYDILPREELVTLLEEAVKVEDVNSIKTEVALIKVAFLKKEKDDKETQLNKFIDGGGKKEDFNFKTDELAERFNAAFSIYKEKKTRYNEALEKQKQDNLAIKLQILEDLKHLIESDEVLKRTYDAFKTLQERWKEIGMVPKSEINNLWQNYNFLVEKFFDKVKMNKELKDLDYKKNLEAKIDLCEKTEELLLEKSITKSFTQLQKYHETWRETGPVPKDKEDEIWERFRNATEKINERRREYFENQHIDQEKNAEAKTALCEKAEQISELIITTIKDWQEQTAILDDLLKTWKTLGAAPKQLNDDLWMRFRTAANIFFNNKKEYFGKFKDEQTNNYNQKLNICLEAEALKTSQDWKQTTEEMIRLQQEWKKIGPVPKKYSDKTWMRFRAACDEFFNARASYFENIGSAEDENLKLKKDLIQQVNDYQFGSDNNENLKIIKDFQRKWMDIGHVPIKNKLEIQKEFRDAINSNLDKLKINPVEKDTIGFKTKFESIAHSPNANQAIFKERTFITSKISEIKNDIKLWENNIGFFAKSKNANLLKEEFQNKIDKAKQEIVVMEEKLKFLKEVK